MQVDMFQVVTVLRLTEQTRRRLAGEGRAELGPKDSVLSVSQGQTGLEWRG